ncbi:MAG: hypothetical protein KME60_07590 [Cyanomargarita calcarea GSE-NOS-MK-12-04C]|uniref:Uncharacterized protein n=1 Tax=Cyanomargarita calcarea GSE-NOS-MK-12-04C TaxID=2839659 RepID=A0A951QJY6_9CYAN|nr:hypothetical protein [Cyanomargarita calcarea GSE-NOS-MK-12-04C]
MSSTVRKRQRFSQAFSEEEAKKLFKSTLKKAIALQISESISFLLLPDQNHSLPL